MYKRFLCRNKGYRERERGREKERERGEKDREKERERERDVLMFSLFNAVIRGWARVLVVTLH